MVFIIVPGRATTLKLIRRLIFILCRCDNSCRIDILRIQVCASNTNRHTHGTHHTERYDLLRLHPVTIRQSLQSSKSQVSLLCTVQLSTPQNQNQETPLVHVSKRQRTSCTCNITTCSYFFPNQLFHSCLRSHSRFHLRNLSFVPIFICSTTRSRSVKRLSPFKT